MTRIRQFAKDMGITYNEAKGLINKGKKRKDGGSTILENYMPIKIVEIKKKKKEVEKPKMRPKKDPFRADKTKSLNEKFSMETYKANEKAIKEIKKAMGGLERYEEGGVKKKKEDPPRDRPDPVIRGRRAPMMPNTNPRLRALKKMGIDPRMKKKDGGAFPDLSGDGKVTQKDILIGRGVIKKKMGGIARGGGAAISGTGFKGVY
tara:strand:+ start:171 stop:785 length:615 start_codon:yes stop_codon:yes gene_type:complete